MNHKKIFALCLLSGALFSACDEGGTQSFMEGCLLNDTKCIKKAIYTCNELQTWVQTSTCPNGCALDGKNCAASQSSCRTGNVKCSNQVEYLCNDAQTWDVVKTCGEAGCSPDGTHCIEDSADCQTGELKCAENSEMICTAEHIWKQVKSCGTLGCSTNGKCNPKATCSGANSACQTGKIVQCSSQAVWEQIKSCPDDACSLDGSQCLINTDHCTPNETKCAGGKEFQCNSAQNWVQSETCDSDGCAPDGKTCASKAALCSSGETVCADDFELECNEQGKWVKTEYCSGHGCAADGKSCDNSKCNSGDTKCVDNAIYRCTDEQTWEKLNDCTMGCAENGKTCHECTAGVSSCRMDTELAICDQDNHYLVTDCNDLGCTDSQACNVPDAKTLSLCAPGTRKCENGAEWMCDSTQNWHQVRTCKSNECDSSGILCKALDVAPLNNTECTQKDEIRCENDGIYHCAETNGQWRWVLKTDCSGYGCHATQEKHFCSLESDFFNANPCAAGSTKCSDDVLYVCDTNQYWRVVKSCNGKGCASSTECKSN